MIPMKGVPVNIGRLLMPKDEQPLGANKQKKELNTAQERLLKEQKKKPPISKRRHKKK